MTTSTDTMTEAPPSTLRPAPIGGGYHVLRIPDDPQPGEPLWDDVLGLINQGWTILADHPTEDFTLVVLVPDDDSF